MLQISKMFKVIVKLSKSVISNYRKKVKRKLFMLNTFKHKIEKK